jgi:hypothetical protein
LIDTRDVDVEQRKKARRAVNRALKNGVLVRPKECSRCNACPGVAKNGKALIDAHHSNGYDDDHLTDIEWLCQSCHQKVHARRHGIKFTDEQRKKISEGVKEAYDSGLMRNTGRSGEENGFYGKTHTPEIRAQLAAQKLGKKVIRTPCPVCNIPKTQSWMYRHGCEVPRES